MLFTFEEKEMLHVQKTIRLLFHVELNIAGVDGGMFDPIPVSTNMRTFWEVLFYQVAYYTLCPVCMLVWEIISKFHE